MGILIGAIKTRGEPGDRLPSNEDLEHDAFRQDYGWRESLRVMLALLAAGLRSPEIHKECLSGLISLQRLWGDHFAFDDFIKAYLMEVEK